jgi:iron complex transport system ATP-binding protein
VIHILTGPVHSGKTTLLKNTIPLLRKEDIRIDGYLSESVWKNNECLGYELIDLKEHQAHPFILKKGKEAWEKVGPYYFVPESLSRAKKIIHRARNSDLAVVDEVGPLELAGKGIWPVLATALFSAQPDFFLVIRDTILEQYLSILKRNEVLVYTATDKITPLELTVSLRVEIEKRRQTRST